MNPYFDQTMDACSNLLGRAKHVEVDADRLEDVAREIALSEFKLPSWNVPLVYPERNEAFVSHCFWMNVINFCYGHCEPDGSTDGKIRKFKARGADGKIWKGAVGLQATLYRLFGENIILASDMRKVLGSYSQFKRNFRGVSSLLPLSACRYDLLVEACQTLEQRFYGDPSRILVEGDYHCFYRSDGGSGVVRLLVNCFPYVFGADHTRIPGVGEFHFMKRAQLFAMIYHGRAMSSGGELQPLRDPEDIGPIVDYQLPKGYLADGIFHYGKWLKRKIDKAIPIRENSLAEVEIRAATFWAHAIELEVINIERLRHGLPPIHVGHLDYYRWMRGREAEGNHHLCLTTNY